jgi:hypothetical protein
MPLFAHWRFPMPIANDAGRGGPSPPPTGHLPSSSSTPTTTTTTTTTSLDAAVIIIISPNLHGGVCFCHFDAAIEQRLHTLHARQRLRGDAQAEIDTYLVACIAPALRHLVLPHHTVPHYDNLPDISAYALGILDPSMDSDPELQQVLLLLRQCTPLRRRTKRAQREVQWREESLFSMQTLVRTMQGTLLGLYPNCLKAIPFGARVGLLRFLRTLLVQPFARLQACVQRIPYIVKLAVMEHLCNTIYDFHPGICHTLNRSGQKVEHFCNSVSTICDIFRGELNTLYCTASAASPTTPDGARNTAIVLEILPRLEKIAHSYFERCTRAYRGIIIGNVQLPRSIDQARRLCVLLRLVPPPSSASQNPDDIIIGDAAAPLWGATGARAPVSIERILAHTWATANQNVFDAVHLQLFPSQDVRHLAWHITQLVRAYPLPHCIVLRQQAALMRRYSGDTACVARCRVLHVCIQCIIRYGSVQVVSSCRCARVHVMCALQSLLLKNMMIIIIVIMACAGHPPAARLPHRPAGVQAVRRGHRADGGPARPPGDDRQRHALPQPVLRHLSLLWRHGARVCPRVRRPVCRPPPPVSQA